MRKKNWLVSVLVILLVTGLLPKSDVRAAPYNYSRYTVGSGWEDSGYWEDREYQSHSWVSGDYYRGYSFDSTTGKWAGTGGELREGDTVYNGTHIYGIVQPQNILTRHIVTSYGAEPIQLSWGRNVYTKRDRRSPPSSQGEARGDYLTNVVAEYGTYPANGKHTDGYWYIVGSPYAPPNTAPTVPGLFTTPASSAVLKGGSSVNVAWGPSTDAEGNLVRYELQFYNGSAWSTLISSTTSTTYTHTLPSINGFGSQYRVRAYDGSAYSSYRTGSAFTIDSMNPTGTITQNLLTPTNGDVTLRATGSDAGSGIKRIKKPDGTYALSSPTTYIATSNGVYTFEFEDNAGNIQSESITVSNIDKTNPEGTLVQSPTVFTNGTVTISTNGWDAGGSGYKHVKLPNGTYDANPSSTYTVAANGTYAFVFEDYAGNTRLNTITVTNIDTAPPTISFSTTERRWENLDVYVQLNLLDTGSSGYKEFRTKWTNDTTKPTSGWSVWNSSATRTVAQNTDGAWYLHVEATDYAGNVTYQYAGIYKIDKSPPVLHVDFSEIIDEKIYSYIGTNKVNFTGTVSENNAESNVEVYYYVENTATGDKTTVSDVLLLDQANNVSSAPFDGRYRIETSMKNGTYNLVVYAKNNVGLVSTETVSFEVANPTSKPSVNIAIHPQPTGNWVHEAIDTYITDSGDIDLITGASKKYEVTNNPVYPAVFSKSLPADRKVSLNQVGVNYLHIQYTLEDGTIISSTAGPYLIDSGIIGNFEVTLENESGVQVTDWTNQDLTLRISDPTSTSMSGIRKQYRVENYHTDWQNYVPGTKITAEGNNRVFARIVTNAGTVSEQRYTTARIDKTAPSITKLTLAITDTKKYNVHASAFDDLSGIKEVQLNTGQVLRKESSTYRLDALTVKPISIALTDHAGNTLTGISFTSEPVVTFTAPYALTTSIYRDNVYASISGTTDVSYKVGSKLITCSATPCLLTIETNTLLTAIHTDGNKQTTTAIPIHNINKSPLKLLLNGERDNLDPTKIKLKWNYDFLPGNLTCTEDGATNTQAVTGTNYSFDGKNYTYDCFVEGTYGGETLKSNRIILYPNAHFPLENETNKHTISKTTNVYVEESKIGISYIINAKTDNYKSVDLPFPVNSITEK